MDLAFGGRNRADFVMSTKINGEVTGGGGYGAVCVQIAH